MSSRKSTAQRLPAGLPQQAARGFAATRTLAAVLALALLVAATVRLGRGGKLPVPALVHGREVTDLHGVGELRAGAGKAQLQLGRPGGLFARALVLEAGGVRALLVALDALLIPGTLDEEVLRAAKLGPRTCLLLAATHTHSGAGGTWNNLLAEAAGNGVYQAELMRAHRDAVVAAIAEAEAALGPAQLAWREEEWPAGPARPRGAGPIDPALSALQLVRAGGQVIATLVVYGMHPTVLRRDRRFVSADWPGEAARKLEEATRAPALVLQGAGASATWVREGMPESPQAAAEALGAQVAAHALESLRQPAAWPGQRADREAARDPRQDPAPPLALSAPPLALSCAVRLVALPPAQASPAVPWPLRTLAGNLLAIFAEPFTVQTNIRLPGLNLRGIPAEVTGDYGVAARGENTTLITLADGYEGYVESPARWSLGADESKTTYYGPGLADALNLAITPDPGLRKPEAGSRKPPP